MLFGSSTFQFQSKRRMKRSSVSFVPRGLEIKLQMSTPARLRLSGHIGAAAMPVRP